MQLRRLSTPTILFALILILGACLRVWGVMFGLPNTAIHPDESAIPGIASGMLFNGLNPRFFNYPSLEFYSVAAIYRIGWQYERWRGVFHHKWEIQGALQAHPTLFFLPVRILAVTAGVATIWAIHRFARAAFDRTVALVAAFFVAVAFLHVRDSHFGVTDVPMTFLATAALLPIGRAFRDPTDRRAWLLGGLLTGLAASTKYNGALLIAVGVAVAVMAWWDARRAGIPARGAAAWGGLTRFGLAAAAGFLAGTPYAVLDFPRFLAGLEFEGGHLLGGHGLMLGRGWVYHLTFSLRYGLGLPLLIAALAGIVWLFVRSWRTALLVCTFPLVYYLFIGRGLTVFVRYMTPIVPILCVPAAVVVVDATRWLLRARPAAAPAAAGVLAVLIAVPSLRSDIGFDTLAGRDDTRLVAAAWLDARRQPSDWIDEEFPASLHPALGRVPGINVTHYVDDDKSFRTDRDEPVTPEWIVVGRSALLIFADAEAQLRPLLTSQYEMVATFPATTSPESPDIFNRQDHFFFPYADFSRRLRSGPDVVIYRRR